MTKTNACSLVIKCLNLQTNCITNLKTVGTTYNSEYKRKRRQ